MYQFRYASEIPTSLAFRLVVLHKEQHRRTIGEISIPHRYFGRSAILNEERMLL
jgi:hypothetical protein